MFMIKNFHLFEKQLQLFDFPKTDKDIVNHVITSHKTKPYINKGKKLMDEFNKWTDREIMNRRVYDYILHDLNTESPDFTDIMVNNQDVFFDYIRKNPKKITGEDWWKGGKWEKENEKDTVELVIKEIEGDYDWYYHIDNYIDCDGLIPFIVKSLKGNFINVIDTEYLNDLESAIYKSKDPYRLQIYRAITLPKNLEELENYDGVGIFWTYDLDKAEAYSSKYDREFILEGWVYTNGINWDETIYKTIYGLKEEREVQLFNNTPIELTKVEMKSFYDDFPYKGEEFERIKKLFSLKDEQIEKHLQKKYQNMSEIVFDDPIWVKT